MIVCPVCGHHNEHEDTACTACGGNLAHYVHIACPICGTQNNAGDLYCFRCLTLLRAENDSSSAVGSTEPGETLVVPADPLAELKQVLPLASASFAPPLAGIPPFETNALAIEQMRLIATGTAEPDPLRKIRPAPKPAAPRGIHWILVITIFLIALGSIIVPFSLPFEVRARDSVSELAQAIASLPKGAVVLVSFDYSPTFAGEMDPLAQAILQQLSQRSARLLIMSTLPTGMGSAERVLAETRQQNQLGVYGQDYILMGYLAGEDSGLRLLTSGFSTAYKTDYLHLQDINSFPLIVDAPTLARVQRVIVLAEDANIVRRWVEQVLSRIPISLDAAVSASAEPSLVPYYLSKQLSSLVAGLPAAVEYAALNGGQAADWRYTVAFAGLLFVLILVAIGANIASLVH
ncbi:MAG: zinc ribbon domain-containing protein [Anaerolineae bacterium]